MESSEAAIAQLGERQTEDLEVLGSIPSPGMFCASAGKERVRGAGTSPRRVRGFGAVGSA